MRLAIAFFAFVFVTHAAVVDGKWTAPITVHGKKSTDKMITLSFDFKTQDGKLTGTVNVGGGKKSRPQLIEDGKVDGDRVTFSSHAMNKKGESTFYWTAAVNDDQLIGTRTREGAKKGQEFTGKRGN